MTCPRRPASRAPLRGGDRVPAVHRHPVPAFREPSRDRGPDTPRPTCNKNRTAHAATLSVRSPLRPPGPLPLRSNSLVIVAQFRAVPVTPALRRGDDHASPPPRARCCQSLRRVQVKRPSDARGPRRRCPPGPAFARAAYSLGSAAPATGGPLSTTACTRRGSGSSGYGLAARMRRQLLPAHHHDGRCHPELGRDRLGHAPVPARRRPRPHPATVNSTFPLWM